MALLGALNLAVPRYAHLPLVIEPGGGKLAKSRCSVALDPKAAAPQLHEALTLLQQDPPAELKLASPRELLEWAGQHWRLERLEGVREVCAPT
jgi:glutamyl-Q tRNA(Asp) synthetase